MARDILFRLKKEYTMLKVCFYIIQNLCVDNHKNITTNKISEQKYF